MDSEEKYIHIHAHEKLTIKQKLGYYIVRAELCISQIVKNIKYLHKIGQFKITYKNCKEQTEIMYI